MNVIANGADYLLINYSKRWNRYNLLAKAEYVRQNQFRVITADGHTIARIYVTDDGAVGNYFEDSFFCKLSTVPDTLKTVWKHHDNN